jgi:hypothetical protein
MKRVRALNFVYLHLDAKARGNAYLHFLKKKNIVRLWFLWSIKSVALARTNNITVVVHPMTIQMISGVALGRFFFSNGGTLTFYKNIFLDLFSDMSGEVHNLFLKKS